MKLIEKYLQGKPILWSDLTQQVPSTTLDKNSEATLKIKLDAVNAIRTIRGDALHYIFNENPRAFNYNKNLMVRGSELLKYPLIYTHMGWMNTKDSNIIPELYYRMGTNGSLDPTHYVSFTNSDTYNPINDSYIDYVLNLALTNNKNLGQSTERNKLGSIRLKSNLNINPVLTGFSHGVDQVTYDPLKTDEEKLSAMAQSSAPLTAAAGFTNPSMYIFTPLMMYSGYNKLKNAENWKDYVLGTGEVALGSLPLIRPLLQGYRAIRSIASPKYALSRAMDSTPLNVDMLNTYSLTQPALKYLFSDWQTFDGAQPFMYLVGHIHDVDVADVGQILSRYGYFENPKPGKFSITAKLPSGKTLPVNNVETQPANFPILVSTNPELPQATWGKRGDRTVAERVISSDKVKGAKSTNNVEVVGFVGLDGTVHVTSSYPYIPYATKSFPVLFNDLNSKYPPFGIAGEINKARKYWDNHAIIDNDAIIARDPFKRGAKKSYIPYTFSSESVPVSKTTVPSIWKSGKEQTVDYIISPVHKERLMNKLNLTEEEADTYIEQELRNLDNVELVDLGPYKVGRPFGHTIGYSVGETKESGSNVFSRVKKYDNWIPGHWSEALYRNFIDSYPLHARAYDQAKKGMTLIGLSEGDKPVRVNAGFEEGTHGTTRGGIDPALSPIITHDTKLAVPLTGSNPGMLDPMEARTFGIELDRAWEALKDNLPDYYRNLSLSALRLLFFYDILRASKDKGERFYKSVPKEWIDRFGVNNNYILNKGANGLDVNKHLYNFWDNFVYNPYSNNLLFT